MIKGKTKTGFAYEIKDEVMDDMELVEALAKTATDPSAIIDVIERILGAEQKKALYEYSRQKDGHVSIAACEAELEEILANAGEDAKNS